MGEDRRTALHHSLLPELAGAAAGLVSGALTVRPCDPRTHWVLRHRGDSGGALAAALGPLPARANTFRSLHLAGQHLTSGDPAARVSSGTADHRGAGPCGSLSWLSPSEWLLMVDEQAAGAGRALARTLERLSTAGLHSVDVSAAQCVIEVAGERAPDLLATGCPLDLDARTFPAGSVAQTLFGKADITILCLASGCSFEVVVRRSVAPYVWQRMVSTHVFETGGVDARRRPAPG